MNGLAGRSCLLLRFVVSGADNPSSFTMVLVSLLRMIYVLLFPTLPPTVTTISSKPALSVL